MTHSTPSMPLSGRSREQAVAIERRDDRPTLGQPAIEECPGAGGVAMCLRALCQPRSAAAKPRPEVGTRRHPRALLVDSLNRTRYAFKSVKNPLEPAPQGPVRHRTSLYRIGPVRIAPNLALSCRAAREAIKPKVFITRERANCKRVEQAGQVSIGG